jgi:uncharacterized repeat protein (TIGR01451 family)
MTTLHSSLNPLLKYLASVASAGIALGAIGGFLGSATPAHAEGSRDLYPAGATGFRAFTEWRGEPAGSSRADTRYANLLVRRTLFRVYANAGESIFLGSSAMGSGNADILVFNPGRVALPNQGGIVGDENVPVTAPDFSCSGLRTTTANAALGVIGSRAQELAGPNTITNAATGAVGAVPNAYAPCYYTAPTSGIYTVAIFGPAGGNSAGDPTPNGSINAFVQPGGANDTTIAAWDITVRPSLTLPTDIPGRLFTYYVSLYTGENLRPLFSSIYVLTLDGYLYATRFNGIDPNGFAAFGNRIGLLDNDGITPLFRDLVGTGPGANQLEASLGNVTIARPEFPLFFTPTPSLEVRAALGIFDPRIPFITPNSFSFQGSLNDNNSLFNTGGTFSYQADIPHSYRIVLSRDGINFDPELPQNRSLDGVRNAGGTITVPWNGLDNSGTPFPIGNNYQAQISIRGGEYHFPLLDVENSSGGPTYEMLNPPGGICPTFPASLTSPSRTSCTIGFYDDRGYRTANGITVGTLGQPLPGGTPPAVSNSDLITGFDTLSAQRAFTGFGNEKALDLWTYFPSQSLITPFNIVAVADLGLTKTVDNPGATIGQTVTFTITLVNRGPSEATNVAVTERPPQGLTFTGVTPSQGTYNNATGVWSVGTVPLNGSATLQITATLTSNNPAVNVAEVTASDQRDPNSIPNNNNPEEDDQSTATLGLPNLRLVKRITAITRSDRPIAFTGFVDDPADSNDTAAGWGQFSPVGVVQINPNEPLSSGDEVEYTVYYLSDGIGPAIAASVCDPVPVRTTLLPTSLQIQQVNGAPVPGGLVYPPLAPLPTGNACANAANVNGSVIFDLGNVPSTPGANFGFVRFRVIVN